MNETPMLFSGLEAQGEINRMEELFGGPERIYQRVPRGRGYCGIQDVFAEYEAERLGRAEPEYERVLEAGLTIK